MIFAEKLTTIAENEQRVYEAGYEKGKAEFAIDPDKIIEKTVAGSVIHVDDVSEIPHKCTVSVDKDASVTVLGKNLFNKDTITEGKAYNSSLNLINYADHFISDYICVCGATQLTLSGCNTSTVRYSVFFDKDKVAISGFTSANKTVNVPSDAKYVRISQLIENKDTLQLELGDGATRYEQYIATTHVITAGQSVEVDSICPTMCLFADNDATISFDYHQYYGA